MGKPFKPYRSNAERTRVRRGWILIALALINVVLGLLIFSTAVKAEAVHARTSPPCSRVCVHHVKARMWREHRLAYIRPYTSFLEATGACESGGTYSLTSGLRAVSPGGKYRGRYQFGLPDWAAAGGHGDPIDASWLEQAYRAVVWLKRNGRQSWPNC